MKALIKKTVVLGAAESGVAVAILAKTRGYTVFVSDGGIIKDSFKRELQEAGIPFEEGGHTYECLEGVSLVIKSPGIREDSDIVLRCAAELIPVLAEIEFAARFISGKIVAITGSNGKTTTSLLAYHLLEKAGCSVALTGNIGTAFSRHGLNDIYDYYIVETSSFQLDNTHFFRPDVAVVLNITPDHLDRYDFEFDRYANAKCKIFQNMPNDGLLLYNETDKFVMERLEEQAFPVGFKANPIRPSMQNGALRVQLSDGPALFHSLPLKGEHNMFNMAAALMIASWLGVPTKDLQDGLPSFVNAPHRLENVGEKGGVLFINDSKATNVDSVFYAFGSFDAPIVWIAGGIDKGNDYDALQEIAKSKVKAIVCLGKESSKLKKYFAGIVPKIVETQDVDEAVRLAHSFAAPGDVALLSPACASFDLFKNYEHRGDCFRASVKKFIEA